MKTNKFRMFGKLYLKDLSEVKMETVLFFAAVAILNIFLYYKANTTWQYENSLATSIGVPVALVFFIPLFESFKLWRDEWKHNTVYLVMSLPVSGSLIILSKIAVILTQFIGFSLFTALSSYLLFSTSPYFTLMNQVSFAQGAWLKLLFIYLTIVSGICYMSLIGFLSSVIGKLFKKYSGAITLVTFLGANYVFSKLSDLFNSIEMSVIDINSIITIKGMVLEGVFPGNVLFSTLISCVVIFFLTVTIYERKVEL